MPSRLHTEVGAPADDIAEIHEELPENRDWVRLGRWGHCSDEFSRQTVEGETVHRRGPFQLRGASGGRGHYGSSAPNRQPSANAGTDLHAPGMETSGEGVPSKPRSRVIVTDLRERLEMVLNVPVSGCGTNGTQESLTARPVPTLLPECHVQRYCGVRISRPMPPKKRGGRDRTDCFGQLVDRDLRRRSCPGPGNAFLAWAA
jgi:hypothetical protein